MSSNLKVNSIVPATGSNVAIGTAGGTISYNANVSGVSTFSQLNVSGQINIGVGGTVITTSVGGNVGVGTDNPGQKLQVDGNIYLKNTGSYIQKDFQDNTEEYILRGPTLASFNPTITWTRSTGTANRGLKIGTHDNVGAATTWVSIWDGIATTPYVPSFKVGRSTSVSVTGGNLIIFNETSSSSHHNNGTYYDSSTGRFNAPVTGYYYFTACVIVQGIPDNTDTTDLFYMVKNGNNNAYSFRRSKYRADYTGTSGYFVDYIAVDMYMQAGDWAGVILRISATVHGNSNYTWFSGHLVG